MVKIIKNGKKIASSKGLEVLSRYNRTKSSVKKATQKGYWLYVLFSDGARAKTKFADHRVLKQWLENKKKRSWYGT